MNSADHQVGKKINKHNLQFQRPPKMFPELFLFNF